MTTLDLYSTFHNPVTKIRSMTLCGCPRGLIVLRDVLGEKIWTNRRSKSIINSKFSLFGHKSNYISENEKLSFVNSLFTISQAQLEQLLVCFLFPGFSFNTRRQITIILGQLTKNSSHWRLIGDIYSIDLSDS